MMNKKAIAAFAAGATLLSGMAFAVPAFAAEGPKQETCKVDQTKVDAAQAKVDEATAAEHTAAANVRKAQAKVNAANAQYTAVKKLNKDSEEAAAKYTLATTTDANKYSQDQKDGFKKAKDDAAAALAKGLKDAYKAITGEDAQDGVANKHYAALADVQAARNTASDELEAANDALTAAKAELTSAQADLAKAECKTTPAPAPQPGPQNPPVTPAQPGSKTEAIKNVLAKKVDVDAAEHNFAEKKEAYAKAAATLTAAKAELDAAEHDAAVAAQNLSDFEASGVNDSAKLQSLKEAVARADAHVVRTTTAFNKALADFNDAKTADLAAQAAYNAAKDAYDEAYNAAIKLGVNPALLPSVTAIDPLSPAFPQLAQAQKIYADALAGKFGAAAQKTVQKAEAKAQAAAPAAAGAAAGKAGAAAAKGELAKGGNGHGKAGEKLGNAGVGVALTALAASMLAGMGAAVRKMRH